MRGEGKRQRGTDRGEQTEVKRQREKKEGKRQMSESEGRGGGK